jgi:hypothetical protein
MDTGQAIEPAEDRRTGVDICIENAEQIRTLMKAGMYGRLETGRLLIEVKEVIGHGGFLNYLKREFNWSERHAQNLMNLYRAFKSADGAVWASSTHRRWSC